MAKLTVPICDASGHAVAANCASEQTSRPSATPGESVVPSGSMISARRTCACRIAPPSGTVSEIVAPLGTTRLVVSSATATAGVNGTASQPVGVKLADSGAFGGTSIVVVAARHDVGSVMKLLESVRLSALSVVSGALVERGDVRVQPAVGA